MKVRDIPSDNLIQLKATSDEICSREDYDKSIAFPVRAFLEKNDPGGHRLRCLVTMYGVPLRVLAPKLTSEEQRRGNWGQTLKNCNQRKRLRRRLIQRAE
jgi:hypothetical protein